MRVILSAHQEALKIAAYRLHKLGANIIPIGWKTGGKAPVPGFLWRHLQFSQQSRTELYRLPFYRSAGIAIVNGSNNWRSIDFDHCESFETVRQFMDALELPANYSYVERTGFGYHVWVKCDDSTVSESKIPINKGADNRVLILYPTNNTFDHLELRWSHCYTIVAPSKYIAKDSYYSWIDDIPLVAPQIVSLANLLEAAYSIAPLTNLRKLSPKNTVFHTPVIVAITEQSESLTELKQATINKLLQLSSSSQSGEWIVHPCLVAHEYHANNDEHPSARFNVVNGYDHCDKPGCPANKRAFNIMKTASLLGLKLRNTNYDDQRYLRRQAMKRTGIFRLLDALAAANKSKELWCRKELLDAGSTYGLSKNVIDKAVGAEEYFAREERATYRLTEKALNYLASIPVNEAGESIQPFLMDGCLSTAKAYRMANYLEVECDSNNITKSTVADIPTTANIARQTGLSTRTIYRYEGSNGLNVSKIIVVSRVEDDDLIREQYLQRGGMWWYEVVDTVDRCLRIFSVSPCKKDNLKKKHARAYQDAKRYAKRNEGTRVVIARRERVLRNYSPELVHLENAHLAETRSGKPCLYVDNFQIGVK